MDKMQTRARIKRLTAAEGMGTGFHRHVPDRYLDRIDPLDDEELLEAMRRLEDRILRRQGRRPLGDCKKAVCAQCGPVWVPERWEVVPFELVDECPWCNHDLVRIPRPFVQCRHCRHFEFGTTVVSVGACRAGNPARFARLRHRCVGFSR